MGGKSTLSCGSSAPWRALALAPPPTTMAAGQKLLPAVGGGGKCTLQPAPQRRSKAQTACATRSSVPVTTFRGAASSASATAPASPCLDSSSRRLSSSSATTRWSQKSKRPGSASSGSHIWAQSSRAKPARVHNATPSRVAGSMPRPSDVSSSTSGGSYLRRRAWTRSACAWTPASSAMLPPVSSSRRVRQWNVSASASSRWLPDASRGAIAYSRSVANSQEPGM
mmetsp:Transcript_71699/g.184935  ORF Transcript_71699/g.184935 Transcript_71699/m.184935 type:complete len:225 (-) Transcript_71699:409-1083(-)